MVASASFFLVVQLQKKRKSAMGRMKKCTNGFMVLIIPGCRLYKGPSSLPNGAAEQGLRPPRSGGTARRLRTTVTKQILAY
jgi:hypothetical protein